MTLSLRATLISLTSALLFAGLGFTSPQWAADRGVDFWNHSRYEAELRQSQKEAENLNELGVRIKERLSLKTSIVHDLIAKRIDLAQAADQFLELNKLEPEILSNVQPGHPAATQEECIVAQVLDHVRSQLKSDPSRLGEIMSDLQRQRQEISSRRSAHAE
jgi:hypothetical protein